MYGVTDESHKFCPRIQSQIAATHSRKVYRAHPCDPKSVPRAARLAAGESANKCPSPLNVLEDAYDHSCD